MKINSILSVFAPSDVKFLPLLAQIAEIVERTADLLQKMFSSIDREQIVEFSKLIKIEESNGDKETNKLFKLLNETFITPFDREDITALTDTMDDIIDIINRVSQKVMLYAPETLPPATLEMAVAIKNGATELRAAINELPNMRKSNTKIKIHTNEIKRFEEEADRIYERGTSGLFRSEIRTVELIKLKEIIQEMEKAANKINGVAKILKTMIVKYA